jgi:predicted esterase
MDEASKRSVLLVTATAYATIAAGPLVVAVILLFVAETWRGHVYAIAGICLLVLPPLVVRGVLHKRRERLLAGGAAALFAVLVTALYVGSPDGRPLAGSRLRSEYLATSRYRRFAVAALLPEIDQVKLGTYVMSVVDAALDHHEAAHVRELSMRYYRPMEQEPEFVALGTVLPDAYADRDAAHVYAYAPPHESTERLPTILFLHGSAGNFKAYLYAWRRFADRTRMLVILPSFGWGDWYQPGGIEAIERARTWAVANMGADAGRIFLVGLSNGGTGVTRAAAANPGAYCGLAFISGFLEDYILRGPRRAPHALPWPLLVVHGTRDDRISIGDVERSVRLLRQQGAAVDFRVLEDEDHFLFFDRDEEVLSAIEEWVTVASSNCEGRRNEAIPPSL